MEERAIHKMCIRDSSNGGGAGTPIPLEHVAVNGDVPGAQLFHVHYRAQGPADEPLDLGGAAVQLQLGDVPAGPLPVGTGEHGDVYKRQVYWSEWGG